MRTGHLFAGGGGGLYADLILGHTPVFAVEWDPYACAVLRSRAADGWFPGLRVHEGDVRLFDPSEYQGSVDCIHAGFPCQDISPAGRGKGINGERSGLYREVLRIAGIVRPRYLFLENSAAILSRGLGTVLGDLAELGYDARWTVLAAAEVGAPHQRDRWWCLASLTDDLRGGRGQGWTGGSASSGAGRNEPIGSLQEPLVADADRTGREERRRPVTVPTAFRSAECRREAVSDPTDYGAGWRTEQPERGEGSGDVDNPMRGRYGTPEGEIRPGREPAILPGWWQSEPDVGRLVNGLALRSHQIKCLGNGQVSLCAATAWKILRMQFKGEP